MTSLIHQFNSNHFKLSIVWKAINQSYSSVYHDNNDAIVKYNEEGLNNTNYIAMTQSNIMEPYSVCDPFSL